MDLVMVVAFLQPSYPFGKVPSPPKIGGILPVESSRSWHRPVLVISAGPTVWRN
jgi:hypothetical protein